MAKAKTEANLPAVNDADLFEGFTPEEIAEMRALSGQTANAQFDKTPVLKINKFSSDIQEGPNPVKMGNFVLGQVTKKEGDNDIIVDIGLDCGANPEITVLKVGTKFSYFPPAGKDKKLICQSQLVLDVGERPRGDNLGFDCKSKECPRRKEGIDKSEKCSCQFVVFCEVTVGDEKKDAIMYAKGESFLPFAAYLQEAGKFPTFWFPTLLKTEKKTKGTNTYWVVSPELLKTADKRYPADEIRRLAEKVSQIDRQAREFEGQRKQIADQRQQEQRKALPPGMSVESVAGKQSSGGAGIGAQAEDAQFDDIVFN